MNFLITGGTGFIGRHLIERLVKGGKNHVTVFTRNNADAHAVLPEHVTVVDKLDDASDTSIEVVINLAGESLFRRKWSEAQKQEIINSRVNLTNDLVDWIGSQLQKPPVLISGSAVGFYGASKSTPLTEASEAHDDFSHQLCAKWEKAALKAEAHGIRVCILRTGIVLAKNGGMLSKMIIPYKLCLGGVLGSGKQYMSWIHMHDMLGLIIHCIKTKQLKGPINATSPNPVTNSDFVHTLGKVLNRPTKLNIPEQVLEKLLGEMSDMILKGQRVTPQKALDTGYAFKYATLDSALKNILQ